MNEVGPSDAEDRLLTQQGSSPASTKPRLKVLISAYACEFGKGSEPEVGWQWSIQMARFHDVTVVTRANNRENIERGIATLPAGHPVPRFIYFDSGPLGLALKARFKITRIYYIWWQRSVRRLIRELCRTEKFDIIHHVTFAGYRYITGIWGHGVPSIWGPIGGMESIDYRLLPYSHPKELAMELVRNFSNFVQSTPTAAFPTRARQSTLTIVSTRETKDVLNKWGVRSVLMPTIGLEMSDFPQPPSKPNSTGRPLRFLFVGQLIWLKGTDLAIEALALSGTDATLHFIGSGPFRDVILKQAAQLRIGDRVSISPRIPRQQVIEEIPNYDVFIFPSLHDSGGFAVLEAMAFGLPVICLDVGGPSLSVVAGCGFRIPLGKRREVVERLAEKIREYDSNREMVGDHGRNARAHVAANYSWESKGEQMNELYLSVANPAELTQASE